MVPKCLICPVIEFVFAILLRNFFVFGDKWRFFYIILRCSLDFFKTGR